jgi:hypothetical protein
MPKNYSNYSREIKQIPQTMPRHSLISMLTNESKWARVSIEECLKSKRQVTIPFFGTHYKRTHTLGPTNIRKQPYRNDHLWKI